MNDTVKYTSNTILTRLHFGMLIFAKIYRTHLRSFIDRTDIGGGGRVRLGDDCVEQEFLA